MGKQHTATGWKFEVTENGAWVAGGVAPTYDDALREAQHYGMMYQQDGGDVRVFVWTGRKPKAPFPTPKNPASFFSRWEKVIKQI